MKDENLESFKYGKKNQKTKQWLFFGQEWLELPLFLFFFFFSPTKVYMLLRGKVLLMTKV